MSEIIQGNGLLPGPTVDQGTRRAIALTSNATPVQVTTKVAHGYFTGDTVLVEGTGIVDGGYLITVIDTLNFQLNGSTAPGSTSTSGYCIDYAIQPAFQVPVPGELASMQTMLPVIQGLANWIPASYALHGKYRLYNYYAGLLNASPLTAADPYSTSWSANATFSTGDNFIPLSGVSLDHLLNNGSNSGGTVNGPVVVNGTDVLEVEYGFSVQLVAGTAVNVTFHLAAFPAPPSELRVVTHTTNTSPVQVTTSTAHGLATNDFAAIVDSGVIGLNNVYQITRIDNFNYTLNGSPLPGTTGGTCNSFSIPFANVSALRPSNWPLIQAPTAGIITPMMVRGVLGGPLVPLSNAPFSPSAMYWFGLFATPVTAANLSQLNLIGPAMCTVRHLRAN